MADEIRIENLEIFAHHGVYSEEKEQGQNFCVNAVLYLDTEKAGRSDNLKDAVDYGAVCMFMNQYMRANTYNLLETVAERMAQELLLTFPEIKELELEVRKPKAPIPLPFGFVSVKIRRGWHRVFIALGSNLGNREEYLDRAVEHLEEDFHFRGIHVSDYLETEPYGNTAQDKFLNGVLEAETLYSPERLLERLGKEEELAGRKREVHWGPRTLDLDILFYDCLVQDGERLTIPHPDMKNRDFVLKPLAELAPYFVHPVYRITIKEMLERLQNT